MSGCKPVTSLAATLKLSKLEGVALSDPTLYRSMVGALQYITLTRPDISFVVNQVCQFLQSPTNAHMVAIKRILWYLKGTITSELIFTSGSCKQTAYCDSDWVGCPNDRCSTQGFYIFLCQNPISWSSKKQTIVARSSTEAEYRSLASTMTEICWVQSILKELHCCSTAIPLVWCDNISAISLTRNSVFHGRTKHIEIDVHFIWEKVADKRLRVEYVNTMDQAVDVFTKGLHPRRLQYLRSKLSIVDHSAQFEGGW